MPRFWKRLLLKPLPNCPYIFKHIRPKKLVYLSYRYLFFILCNLSLHFLQGNANEIETLCLNDKIRCLKQHFWIFAMKEVAPADEQVLNQCIAMQLEPLGTQFATDARCAFWWPNLQLMQVVPCCC